MDRKRTEARNRLIREAYNDFHTENKRWPTARETENKLRQLDARFYQDWCKKQNDRTRLDAIRRTIRLTNCTKIRRTPSKESLIANTGEAMKDGSSLAVKKSQHAQEIASAIEVLLSRAHRGETPLVRQEQWPAIRHLLSYPDYLRIAEVLEEVVAQDKKAQEDLLYLVKSLGIEGGSMLYPKSPDNTILEEYLRVTDKETGGLDGRPTLPVYEAYKDATLKLRAVTKNLEGVLRRIATQLRKGVILEGTCDLGY